MLICMIGGHFTQPTPTIMALKSILKNTEAGPSRTKAKASVRARVSKDDAPKSKSKAAVKATASKPTAKGKGVRIDAPVDSSDDNDFGDDEPELDTDDEIERAQAPAEKKQPSTFA